MNKQQERALKIEAIILSKKVIKDDGSAYNVTPMELQATVCIGFMEGASEVISNPEKYGLVNLTPHNTQ